MSLGWIKLHRKLLDSQVFANEGLLKVWIYCLCRANHDVSYVPITTGKGTTEVKVDKGQFIFGRKSSAKDLGMNQSTLYKRLKKLEKLGNCNTQSNSHYTLVTICNWETYQDSKKPLEQGKEQPSNNQVTTREQPSNTDKNDNNYKNEKKIIVSGKAFDDTDLIFDVINETDLSLTPQSLEEKTALLCLHIWHDVNNLQPNNKTTLKAKLGTWYHPIRLMIEQDYRTIEEIWKLWKQIQRDEFWKANILSPSKLREQFDNVSIKLKPKKQGISNEFINSLYE